MNTPATSSLTIAQTSPGAGRTSAGPGSEPPICHGFFKSSIALVLTLGAVWGAWLLLRIGFNGSFTAVGLHEVNAHGHAQIFGWVGLFVMGFAYQKFPHFWQTRLAWPRLAKATLGLMVAGILLRGVCEPLVTSAMSVPLRFSEAAVKFTVGPLIFAVCAMVAEVSTAMEALPLAFN